MKNLSSEQMKYLARNPSALMKFEMTGRAPATVRPSSPLITLIESIPPRLQLEFKGVRVAPALGYQNGQQFHNLAQMLLWLKPRSKIVGNVSWPAESCRIKSFNKQLKLADLRPFCAKWPDKATLDYYCISE